VDGTMIVIRSRKCTGGGWPKNKNLAHHGYPISSGTLYPVLHRMETGDASKPGRPVDTGWAPLMRW
jgi:hypothetical protein